MRSVASAVAVLLLMTGGASAQKQPSNLATGDPTVSVGGQSAAREGDVTTQGDTVGSGSTNVFIGGKPAATAGSNTDCGGVVAQGSSNVFVNGKPLATGGSVVTSCAE